MHFLTFFNTDQRAPKKTWYSNYIALYKKKTDLRNDFGPQKVPQPENT